MRIPVQVVASFLFCFLQLFVQLFSTTFCTKDVVYNFLSTTFIHFIWKTVGWRLMMDADTGPSGCFLFPQETRQRLDEF